MFDKIFETVARKQLTMNAFDKMCMARQYQNHLKRGYIVKFPNGKEGFNVVKHHADVLKMNAFMWGVAYPAAAIIGSVLGNMNSKN